MARRNSRGTESLSTTPPVLTGESRTDWALWEISAILAEIAKQAAGGKNHSGGEYTEAAAAEK